MKSQAQTNNSPYSIIGIGDIEDSYFNRTTGMSNTGIAYRHDRSLISNNPASFSGMDNQFFAGELGIRAKFVNYYGAPINSSQDFSSDIAFRRFAAAIKLTNHWGTSIGLVPFSSENYEFTAPQPILGTSGETAPSSSQGYGGINRVYWANAYEFFRHLSIGINSSYLFGSISQKTILQNANAPSTYISSNKGTFYNNFYFDYGLQYYTNISKRWNFSLGATFANKTGLNTETNVIILNIDSAQLNNNVSKTGTFYIPTSYGVGISLTKDKKYTFVADYKHQDWTSLHYAGFNYALQNSDRYSAGFEISNKKTIYNATYEASFFQAGFYYNKTYLIVYGQPIRDIGGTIGIGLNAKRSTLSTNIIFQYGIKGTETNNLIQERYFNFTIILSYRELWYTKGRRYE
ncbi:MAG TPA: hypothetical protein VMI12_08885 [Puia sp.]|nr:hypothetical protein [Puia sp.]